MNEGLGPCEQPPRKFPNRRVDAQMTNVRVMIKTWHITPYWQLETIVRPHTTTVAQFKQTIFEKTQYPVEKQRIVTAGRLMQDHKLLSAYRLHNDEILFMVKSADGSAFLRKRLSQAGLSTDSANYVMKSAVEAQFAGDDENDDEGNARRQEQQTANCGRPGDKENVH